MSGIYTPLIGRFGNKMFQYAHARLWAEECGCDLVTPRWEGEDIFCIQRTRPRQPDDLELGEYRQQQKDLIYTRQQVKEWFTLQSWVTDILAEKLEDQPEVLGHRRVGDYFGYGYPVISRESYTKAAKEYGYGSIQIISDEEPWRHSAFDRGLEFVPDFFALMHAKVLFRGNSTFSWWAATLGSGKVYSPVVAGLAGGIEHDVNFVPGNHPRFCDLPCVTDLHIPDNEAIY
jgi:hypothetical protein